METVKQIQELTSVTTADNSDYLVLEQEEGTKKITKSNFLKEVNSSIDDLNTKFFNVIRDSNADLNDYQESGIYYFPYNYPPANIPAGSNGWLIAMPYSNDVCKQLWFRHGTADSNDWQTYVRTKVGGSWGSWRRYAVMDDVDSVDGKLSNYLPLSGGTLTANLTINRDSSDTYIRCSNSAANVYFGVSSAGNRGMYDTTLSTWNFYRASGNSMIFGSTGYPTYLYGSTNYVHHGSGNNFKIPELLCGSLSITPSAANTPTASSVTFSTTFSSTPRVVVGIGGTVPGTTVTGCSSTSASTTGFTAYVTRTNTTSTNVYWIAMN